MSGSSDLYSDDGRRPFASINFVASHDGFTLRDLVSYDHKHNAANGEDGQDGTDANRSCNHGVEGETDDPAVLAARRRSMRNMLTMLLLSTGVPMLVAGDELGRTQGGNNNAYCLDSPVSWLDWELAGWQRDQMAWARALLAVRREHPVFRHRHYLEGRPAYPGGPKDLACRQSEGCQEAEDPPHQRPLFLFASCRGSHRRGAVIVTAHPFSNPPGSLPRPCP